MFESICLYCKKEKVPVNKWNLRCKKCKLEGVKPVKDLFLKIGKKQPIAVVKDKEGNEVYLDKEGKQVDNPGYDLKNDPRGWEFTGTKKPERTRI